MSDVNELYQEMILEHNRKPRNFHALPEANSKSEGYNPLCGDRITVYLDMENGVIKNIGFQGSGCAISKASASMMTSAVKGKTKQGAEELVEKFRRMLHRDINGTLDSRDLGKLAVFSGVWEYPARIKCAALAWHTLLAGLEEQGEKVVTTEGESNS